jgi:hypothetical protein
MLILLNNGMFAGVRRLMNKIKKMNLLPLEEST